jgi:hypothetical protein
MREKNQTFADKEEINQKALKTHISLITTTTN